MSRRSKNFIMAVVFSVVIMGVAVAGYTLIPEPTLQRIFQLFGGRLPGGIIQLLTYIAFFWGIFEINERSHRVKYERQSFDLGLLPEQEDWVLAPEDVNELRYKATDVAKEQQRKLLLVDLIKKACTKFRANHSISDLMEVVSTQVKINMAKAESSQSMIRYLAWAIPSVGFIGTILGIAQALGLADQADDPEKLGEITSLMYVAFDTTLIALLLSIIMMLLFHNLQESEDDLHADMEEYVLENLVNRIHLE